MCSLRDAIQAANTDQGFGTCTAGSGADTVVLGADTYDLTIAPTGNDDNSIFVLWAIGGWHFDFHAVPPP